MPKFAGSQARAIGAEIRGHRSSHERSLEWMAAATDISRATLSRIETGARRPSVDEVASILTVLGVAGADKQRLIRLAHDESERWVGVGDGIAQQLRALQAYESEATAVTEFQISVIPGLLQTPEYAEQLIRSSPRGRADLERLVAIRIGRQPALSRPDLVSYRAFIDEAALVRAVGGPPTMADQLRRLTQAGRQGYEIRLLPFDIGWYWGGDGGFTLYERAAHYQVVFVENEGAGVFLDDESANQYQEILHNLDDLALSGPESEALLTMYVARYEDGSAFP